MQVVVIPFRIREGGDPEYALFRRTDDAKWQPIAGGAEDSETASMAARREASEEAGLPSAAPLYQLQALDTVPVVHFQSRETWPADLYVVPQFSFGIDATSLDLEISHEHTQFDWLDYAEATARLAYQSNATALWELHERVRRGDLPRPVD
jgi:dihydroneopterin triphosphate diphosphatase